MARAGRGASKADAPGACQLRSARGQIKHVIYLQFDNSHFRRDTQGVPSDLEQMPHLLNFLRGQGTLLTNDHTILIAHTAGGILSSFTGLYPDRNGITVSNSYRYFTGTGPTGTSSSAAFKYWTDLVDDTGSPPVDPNFNMVTDGAKNTPAPWVPYTRAGCDFGAVSAANLVLENTGTGPHGDITEVFGNPSTEATEATTSPALAQTDFVGIAVHCASGGGICKNNTNARPDLLPDEPGGYTGFQGLFGAKYVDPAITNGNPCVNDTSGQPIKDPAGNCGFPGFDGMLAKVTLGYVAQMQEAGVPVTFAYLSDAHDNHTLARASGPGEADYVAQLKAYDDAFAAFFARLQHDGITPQNTLFVVTVDEGDHFAGGKGTPQPDGTLAYTHANCADVTACPSNQIGEVNLNVASVLPAGEPVFTVHSDSAPTFYVQGQPGRTDPTVRKLERDVGAVQQIDPYGSTSPTPVVQRMADPVEEQALHMVNADPARTPTFTAFANPDFFLSTSAPACGGNPCVDYHFAWNHGDVQDEIGNTWLGLVGPGVDRSGLDSRTWSDHTDVRPTMLALLGLRDDYTLDGRVLVDSLDSNALPQSLRAHHETLRRLGEVYKQLNAPFGQFGQDTLQASTRALVSNAANDADYTQVENAIAGLTAQRDALAGRIKADLGAAEFGGHALDEQTAKSEIDQGERLISQAHALTH
jgi:hypothetical protein